MMWQALTGSGLRLSRLLERIQEHAGEAVTASQDSAGGAAAATTEEWGVEAMMHHVVDSPEWDVEPFFTLRLPELPAFHIGSIPVDLSVTKHVLFLLVATVLTILTMFLAARASRRLDHGASAPRGILGAVEGFYMYLRDEVAMSNIGHGGEKFVPLVITFFFFILYANLIGLVPFGATATGNIMVTSALAVIALLVIETAGFAALGPRGYMKTIFYLPPGLPAWMKPIMLAIMAPVELIGKFSKIVALAIRLFANMTAGHFVILALLGLILTYGSFSGATGIFAVIGAISLGLFVMLLEIFIAFIQAYIFAMLVAVFIGLIRHAH